jgi:polyhydroxybutyrate depolymerase
VLPLVIALHCYGCAPEFLSSQLDLPELAQKHHFVVASPRGHVDSRGRTFWNATAACCDFEGKGYDDVGAVVALIDDYVKRGVADPKRVYLVGFSNGGFLAWRVACEHADKVAAIVSIGGGAPETCRPSSPVAALDVHGSGDDVVPIDGHTLGAGLPQRGRFPTAAEALKVWARVDGCAIGAAGCRVQQWILPGGHWPTGDSHFGERIWTWLAAQHK